MIVHAGVEQHVGGRLAWPCLKPEPHPGVRDALADQRIGTAPVLLGDRDDLVELVLGEISGALSRGEGVKLSSFGSFGVRQNGERVGRNPKTGEEIPISARRVVTFRPGQKLRARVEAYVGSGN